MPLVVSMIFCSGSSAQRCTSRSRNQSSDVYPWMHVSGRTIRSEFSLFACSIALMMRAVLLSKSPLVVLICPIVTRIFVVRTLFLVEEGSCTIYGIRAIRGPFVWRRTLRYILSATHADGSHNGSAAVLKTAGRKAMQVRVLSPPPLHPVTLHHSL